MSVGLHTSQATDRIVGESQRRARDVELQQDNDVHEDRRDELKMRWTFKYSKAACVRVTWVWKNIKLCTEASIASISYQLQ